MSFFARRYVKKGPWNRWRRGFILGYAILVPLALHNYIDWLSAGMAAGLIALMLTPVFEEAVYTSPRYGIAAIAFFLLFLLIPVKTILYLGMACTVLFFRESFYGRTEHTVPFLILLLSPIAEYVMNLFSFPIRLQLTALAGKMIGSLGMPVQVAGNMLTNKGHEFSVDPACMGLHMLQLSLLTGIILMNFYQKRQHRRLNTGGILILLALITGLNVLANLCRIVCLVLWGILPDNPMHGLIGMLCMVLYILLPMIPLTRWAVRRYGAPVKKASPPGSPPRSPWLLAGNILAGSCLLVAVPISLVHDRSQLEPDKGLVSVPGYTTRNLCGHILQLNNSRSLVYIKPIPDFYYTDHLPAICWQGNGYAFHFLQEERIGSKLLYTGLLQNGKDTLYTAWWYDNGSRHTISQLDWREDVLRGGNKYSVINITTASRKELEEEIRQVLEAHPFREVIGRRR
jgi:exosortase N